MEGTHGVRKRHWNEADARAALEELSRSKLSLAAFARSKGVSTERFRFWKKRLAETEGVTAAPTFVAVTLPSEKPSPPAVMPRCQIELVVGAVVVRVREEIDADRLARLIVAFNRRAPTC